MEDMKVLDENDKIQIKEENKIPRRLSELLRVKGINIEQYGVLRVGGDGKCGARCVSIHTTGTESCAGEIRTNVNRHIIEEWEIYQDSYEYPYQARIGGGTKIFKNQEELLIFLMEEEDEASKMWMTHVCMQATSTMLNMNINILTTGISTPKMFKCVRCKPTIELKSEDELILHNENVHNRKESFEEREGRLQKARWTHLTPDYRIKDSSQSVKAEELTLIHEDEIHYNIMLPHNHSAFKNKRTNHTVQETTLFGEPNKLPDKKSWAQVTEAFRPGLINPPIFDKPLKDKHNDEAQGWKTVKKGRKMQTNDKLESTNVSTHNRFEKLMESDCVIETNITHNCPNCDNKFISKTSSEKHVQNCHVVKKENQRI